MAGAHRSLRAIWLGRRDYRTAYTLQVRLRDERTRGDRGDTLLLLEHDPVITLGRGGRPQNLLATEAVLAERGVDWVRTDRGGDITLHAPGQLVAYPIVDLKPDRRDVRRYVRDLAEVMRRLIEPWCVDAGLVDGMVGLWVDAASPSQWPGQDHARQPVKIGAIGVRIARWVTLHGFALNLTTDLGLYDLIVPCGISQYGVTSVARLTGKAPEVAREAAHAAEIFGQLWDCPVAPLEDRSADTPDTLVRLL